MVNPILDPSHGLAERLKGMEAAQASLSTQPLGQVASALNADGSAYAYNNNVPGTSPYAVWVGNDGANHFGKNVSSIRYKENVIAHDIDPAAVLQLRPVLYDLIGGDPGFYGLIAEQVSEHVPEIVQWFEGHIEALRYDLLGVPLLAVAKDHDGRIASLETQLASALARINALETQVQAPIAQWSPPAQDAPTYTPPAYSPTVPAAGAPVPEPAPLPYTIQP